MPDLEKLGTVMAILIIIAFFASFFVGTKEYNGSQYEIHTITVPEGYGIEVKGD